MYNSSYSRATFGLEAKQIHKAKGKSCGYYMRTLFFFSSLIQSLIIASLVLFLVYGQPEKTAEEKRVEELELAFNKLSTDNTKLRKDKADLTSALKAKTGEKDAADKEIAKLKNDLNLTTIKSSNFQKSLSLCEASKMKLSSTRNIPLPCPPSNNNQNGEIKTLNTLLEQQKVLYGILKSNFSQTMEYLKADLDNAVKDKNEHHSLVIQLRQENLNLKSQLDVYTKKCKEDFAESLQGIQTVTSAFLTKIDNFFTNSVTFHLTCSKQEEQMARIRSNCSSLSRQVEDKFQSYLDNVGAKVSSIQKQSSRLEVQNAELTSELDKCRTDREKEAAESSKNLQDAQQKYDKQLEQLLKEQSKLRDAKELVEAQLAVKDATHISLQNGCVQQPKPAGLQPPGIAGLYPPAPGRGH
ncbi:plasmalemma vesicle associated protein b [Sinocyclocheilus grahami]|uniref:Plasmalemma vesicle associated protein b n=1 Tax=Sinocyclocheilus grahami TaxID=75366 RepID=A0A672RCQ5_SINGR|nr:PREDICTED: plasmalemma vesicle-associated protein [Sinocyclocheilus grahami]